MEILKVVSGVMLTLLLVSMLTLAFNIQQVRAEPTIWTVDDDGPADFNTIQAAINAASPGDTINVHKGRYYEHVVVNKTVTLTGEERSNTIIDGNFSGNVVVITVAWVTINGFTIRRGGSENYLSNSGILVSGDNNIVSGNILTENGEGMTIFGRWCSVTANNITRNGDGILCDGDGYNNTSIYHNNFVDNGNQAIMYNNGPEQQRNTNYWDNGYPSGGNYWSDYTGVDVKSGPNQDQPGNDGIGDTPYIVDANSTDRYPMVHPFNPRPWDLTGPVEWLPDGICDMRDMAQVAKLYGYLVGDGQYDRRADLTGPTYLVPDLKIDIRDIALACKHFGETYIGEITILDDRFDTGLDNWVYWGGPGYVVEWVSNAAKISGDHVWPPLVDCGMQKVVDLSAWGEHGALLLSFDWRATSDYSSSCTTNAQLWIQDADSGSELLFVHLITGGTLDTGWRAYFSDISSYVTGHSNIRIILYLMDNYANFHQMNFYDNIELRATSP